MTTSPGIRISRRGILRAGLKLVAGSALTALGATAYATEIEPRWPKVDRVRVPIQALPPTFNGYRIVQLSDIHLGSFTPPETITRAIRIALDLAPDLIALTGDYVLDVMDTAALQAELGKLAAHGHVFATMGNHDHWLDPAGVRLALANAGIPELQNASRPIVRGDQAIWLMGVDDIWERHHDLPSALADVPPDAVSILLAHEPDYADEATLTNQVTLQLSGHSHGGQVRIPGIGAPILPYLGRKYPYGLRRIGSMWLYTNRGVGEIPPAVRVNCRPEIAEITLCQA
ncbi:MAG: metallophosphoesterase [Anaerolineae bacterium]|nr:metallophosphoesterase [Anaerolineae bacterium]